MDSSEVFITKQGKINFVDLAGSEMSKKTQSSGKTLEEANNINKSLMVLGYCISSLSDPKRRKGHIPYRDSKLTKLLSDSLAGSGVTLMIACISPASSNVCETLNTLRYAARAKRIRTKPIVVMDPRESLIMALKREVEALESENKSLKAALDLNKSYVENMKKSTETCGHPSHMPPLNTEKLAQMDSIELVDLIKHYAAENEALRKENSDLFHSRDVLIRDHELVCRENERLIKKIESHSSSVSTKRTSHSADIEFALDTADHKTNIEADSELRITSSNLSNTETLSELPSSIQKEMDIKRVGSTSDAEEALKIRKNSAKKYFYKKEANEKSGNVSFISRVFGKPLSDIRHRRASIEHLSMDEKKRITSSKMANDTTDQWTENYHRTGNMESPKGRQRKSPSFMKVFGNPFGSPVQSIV